MSTVHETDQEPLWRFDKQRSILLVDGMENNCHPALTALSNANFRIVEARDGEEALRCLTHQAIDVVLLNITPPGMSGFEICKKIREMREMQGLPEMPMIILISDDDMNGAIASLNAGAIDFIIKPFRSDELRARLAVAVERIRLKEELASARHIAESALNSQTKLLNMMNHEIRIPMNAILGLSYLGLQARLDKTPRNYLEKINFSVRSLLSIIDDAFDFSRIESGKLKLSENDFNVRECVAQAHGSITDLARDKGLGLKLDISQDVPDILRGDAARLSQVLMNLATVAVRFTDKGAVTLHVSVNAFDGDSVELMFIIRGAGIHSQHVERVSEWLKQTERSRDDMNENSTLSLVISRELIDMMHGRIWVERSSDRDGSFHCTVRLTRGHQMVNTAAPLMEELESAKARINGARILIIEDNSTDQLVIRDLLELAGAMAVIASKAQDAADRLSSEKFDMVIINSQWVAMHDLEGVRRVRSANKNPHLRIIAVSDPVTLEDRNGSVDISVDDYLIRPVNPEQMYRILAKWLPDQLEKTIVKDFENMQPKPLPVDISVLHQMFHNNATLVRKFGLKFVEVATDTLAEMNIAQAEKDLPALGRLGHKLKSSARTIGALSFADLCEKLERANLNNNWSNAESLLKQIPVVLTQITQQLEQEFRTMDK